MKDFATSSDPGVQAQLDRLAALSLPQGRIGIEAMRDLLGRLGHPQRRMPPAFHIAGTNGKGSTSAFLRAMLEAQGLAVHATTSPHLVRYNERIRIAGDLIADDELAALLGEVLDASVGLDVSFFETTIAAAFLAFSRNSADACVIEVGLGGRLDATNVIEHPVACAVATLGIDHERFLLAPEAGAPARPLARIAWEKASIAKPGSPLVTLSYPADAAREIEAVAQARGAVLAMQGRHWWSRVEEAIHYRDAAGELTLPLPALPGRHQADNAALAAAMLRHQSTVTVSDESMAHGIHTAKWPARLQRLGSGPLTVLAAGRTVWLDGGHNRDAGEAIARHFSGKRLHLILGMLANKDPASITAPLAGSIVSLQTVEIPGHDSHPRGAYGPNARPADDVPVALAALPDDGLPVLIAGSLYLAGEVLRLNAELPD